MLSGGPTHAIGFSIPAAGLGDSYSLVAANFRTGDPPPTGRDEMLLAVDSPATGGVTLTIVKGWLFHVDFNTPTNSTLGIGTDHSPNAQITVNGFVDAFTTTSDLVPQQGTSVKLDTVGDRIMTPVVYQNLAGTESLWADQTVIENYPTGPTAVRWYQFDVTGGIFPATAVQQQDWDNAGDGLWRWMPSIAVDEDGNTVMGYSTSSTTIVPSIRYAGRLASDPPGNLAQGEGIMWPGVGPQTTGSRWGAYTRTEVDPSDGMSFWHVNQYAQSSDWHTRIGKFNFVGGSPSPTPSPTPTPTATPTPSPSCTPIVIMGSIDTGDPTQTDRLFRSTIPQTCPATTTCAIDVNDQNPHLYDWYTFTNTTGSTQCVTIDTNTACTGTRFIFVAAYLGELRSKQHLHQLDWRQWVQSESGSGVPG